MSLGAFKDELKYMKIIILGKRARDIASISIVIICGHVNEEDPCCDDDVDGATIEMCNVYYPEIPCQTTTTDGTTTIMLLEGLGTLAVFVAQMCG